MNLRKPILAALGALILALALPQAAQAQSYQVRQCHPNNPAQHEVNYWAWERTNQNYGLNFRCNVVDDDNGIRIRNGQGAGSGQRGRAHWTLPSGIWFSGVNMHMRLRREEGHVPQIYAIATTDVQSTKIVLAQGQTGPTGWQTLNRSFALRKRFALELRCVNSERCPGHNQTRAQGRNFVFTVQDTEDPRARAHRTGLLSGGWKRGIQTLTISATDVGSGINRYTAQVNGATVAPTQSIGCSGDRGGWAAVFVPCDRAPGARSGSLSTTHSSFRNGSNTVRACARDYSGRTGCDQATVLVDNLAPSAVFLVPSSADPELIRVRVRDEHSGVDAARSVIRYRRKGTTAWSELGTSAGGGEIVGRVDSESGAPGEYEWEARIYDRAGNLRVTRTRVDGEPMVVGFPMREKVRLPYRLENGQRKATIGYADRRRIRGRLLNSSGRPIANSSVRVVERMAGRARPKRRVTVRGTNENGGFALRLARGPSRRVWVEYAGSRRYRPAAPPRRLAIKVRGRAALRSIKAAVRAGDRVAFRGRIGRRGMVLPSHGKLYELQVKAGPRRWITVGKARRTRPDGRFRATHRFGPQSRPTRFRFRVRVMRERGWGYAPTRSRARRVTVRPRG